MVKQIADQKVFSRLARVEGQIRGLSSMLKDGRDCLDVVAQIRAARSGLARVEQIVLAERLKQCVETAIESRDPSEQRKQLAELIDLVEKSDT